MRSTNKQRGPAYLRIESYLKSLIQAGAGRSEPLPPEPDLAREFAVSRMTVRQAYQRLVNAGAVVRYPGLGSFVTGHIFEELPIQGVPNLQSWVVRGNENTGRKVLEYKLLGAPASVAKALGAARGTKLTYVQLLRFRNGVPSLDTRYIPAGIFKRVSKEEMERRSILEVVVEQGHQIAAGQVEIDAHRASRKEAALLGIRAGDPVLERRVLFSDPRGRRIVLGNSRYPSGNAYTFKIDFHRVEDMHALSRGTEQVE